MAGGDRSQKTEKPTPRRLKEARERGQVARSPEIVAWTTLLTASVLVQTTVAQGAMRFRAVLGEMGAAIANPDEGKMTAFAGRAVVAGVLTAAPVIIGITLLVVVVNLAQVGLKPSLKRLKPELSRLNVFKGIKRMVSPQAWWELLKSIIKVGALTLVAWPTVAGLARTLGTQGGSLAYIAQGAAAGALTLVRNVSAVGLVIAAADYVVQRRRVTKDLMMTKHEVLEELKQHEGDPRLRSAIRSRQQAISRNRMIRMVATADVVVVNPTHYAVALKYDASRGAPEVLAKGADHLAARIRLEATKHTVPIVHEPTLARALYKAVPVGGRIPVQLYEAVAHLLAFVYALRARGRDDGYHEFGRALVDDEREVATVA